MKDNEIRERACAIFEVSGELEIDNDAEVIDTLEGGAWVQAWVYVDLTTPPQ